ncbi:MAG: putative 5' nucleotidase family protein [Streblomastix strix]|uniref:Putative 5' nucleotidase family protein n=1 Tax=Streblomastix strix TaxID=222440 RepID=A0A5J4UXE9_9EUKA|nr:MAG: putative 5' nucleotidase family protein [Streblomastix strix]
MISLIFHGWINGHRHIPELDADIADYYNFVQHTKELLTKHIVLAFDSGDQTQGTGLSDQTLIPGEFIFEMLEKVPIDGFTIGNHEMYNNSCIDNIADKVQPAMKGRYITSNSHHIDPNKKLGENYKIIKVENFGSILVFGYIYSFTLYQDHANVTSVPDAIKEEWLKDVLNNNSQQFDDEYPLKLVILLVHNDPADSETDLIVNKIREYRPDLPILVLGGHTHIERIVMKDDSDQLEYRHQNGKDVRIENQLTNVTDQIVWDYSVAVDMRNSIQNKVKELKLDEIIGCSDKTYGHSKTDKINLFDLLINTIYPKVKPFGREKENSSYSNPSNTKSISTIYIYNSQSLRAPLHQGEVTQDDFLSVDPGFNTFCAFRGVTGQDMRQLMDMKYASVNYILNEEETLFSDHYLVDDEGYKLFSDKDKDDYYEYDIVTASYDCPRISQIFQRMNSSSEVGQDIKYPIHSSNIVQKQCRRKTSQVQYQQSETSLLDGSAGKSSWAVPENVSYQKIKQSKSSENL